MLTNERAKELCAELSLIDMSRLLLTKAAGPEGLSASSARSMEAESDTHVVIVRRKPAAKKQRVSSRG